MYRHAFDAVSKSIYLLEDSALHLFHLDIIFDDTFDKNYEQNGKHYRF